MRISDWSSDVCSSDLFRDRHGATHDLAQASAATLQRIRGAEIAMIFQEPMTSLNPLYTVGDQIAEAVLQHEGGSRAAALQRARDMLARVEIPAAARRVHDGRKTVVEGTGG